VPQGIVDCFQPVPRHFDRAGTQRISETKFARGTIGECLIRRIAVMVPMAQTAGNVLVRLCETTRSF